MVPIEFKTHKYVTTQDRLELGFYWLLLEPQRTRDDEPPRGIVVLRREGMPVSVEVEIGPHCLAEVRQLLAEVRAARKMPVAPQICGCNVCAKVRREEVRSQAAKRKDLTMLFGLGPRFAKTLEGLGVADYEVLADRDPVDWQTKCVRPAWDVPQSRSNAGSFTLGHIWTDARSSSESHSRSARTSSHSTWSMWCRRWETCCGLPASPW